MSKRPGSFGNRVAHHKSGISTSSTALRYARDEEEAVIVAKKQKTLDKQGRREQKEESDRRKITLPRLKFLEKDPD